MRFQKDIPSEDLNPTLHCETLILYGNILAAQNSLSEAVFYYDSALSSNPNKDPLEPTNLRAWYNKGMSLRRQNVNLLGRLFIDFCFDLQVLLSFGTEILWRPVTHSVQYLTGSRMILVTWHPMSRLYSMLLDQFISPTRCMIRRE